jgi:small-conductance mechanosensitive channel
MFSKEFPMTVHFDWRQAISSVDISTGNAVLAALAALATFAFLRGLVAFLRCKLSKLSEKRVHQIGAEILHATLASTSIVAIFMTSLLVGLAVLSLPSPWDERVKHLWFIALGVQLAVYLHRAIAICANHYFTKHAKPESSTDTVAHTLIIWGAQSLLWIVFFLAILSNLGINISTFLASLGIGGIAIALAAQNILGDLFASLAIAIDKPFEVGDSISVNAFSGTVEHVGLKTTRVRSDSGEQIVIANTELLKNTLRNFKRMSQRRVQFSILVNPDTPHAMVAKFPAEMRKIIDSVENVRFDRAHLKSITPKSLEFDVVYYVCDSSFGVYMDAQQSVLLQALALMPTLGISTAEGPRHVFLETSEPGSARPTSSVTSLHRPERNSQAER